MTSRIEILSPRLANQIAAGEVVERPASVIKELLENALDAGATRIDIDVERGGVQLLRITDNGHGIHPDDLPLALARHATSKIKTLDDLAAVMSLGFRGEALASIASVSRLTLISRQRDQNNAWLAFAEGAGMQVEVRPAALDVGTRVEVRDLFFNTPARRRFLRSENTEFAHIDETVRRVALARPDVAVRLTHNGKTVRNFRVADGKEGLAERVSAVLGRSFLVTAVEAEQQIEQQRIFGWIGHPEQHRAQADGQYVFVNGRAIRDRVVNHAIRSAYEESLPKGRAPCWALFIEMPAELVDVNVHPTKHEVRFRHARWMHDWITQTIRESLQRLPETVAQPVSTTPVAERPISSPAFSPSRTVPSFAESVVIARPPAREAVKETMAFYQTLSSETAHSTLNLMRVSETLMLSVDTPLQLWHLPTLLHAFLQQQWLDAKPAQQPLLMPISLPLLSNADEEKLRSLGFAIDKKLLKAAPSLLRGANWAVLCQSLLEKAEVIDSVVEHLLNQPVSKELGYWQEKIAWAHRQGVEHCRRELRAEDWQQLWPN